MRLSLGQDLRMIQKQVLAPRMIQSMEILQLPILALQERIEQEMEENPVLEVLEEETDLATTPEEPAEQEPPDAPSEEERELVIDELHSTEGDFERLLKVSHIRVFTPTLVNEFRFGYNRDLNYSELDAMANM